MPGGVVGGDGDGDGDVVYVGDGDTSDTKQSIIIAWFVITRNRSDAH